MMDRLGHRPLLDEAFVEIHSQLRRLARAMMRSERPGHTLEATAVVHEVYLRLLRSPPQDLRDPQRFLAAAAVTVRRVLIDHARRCQGRRRHRHDGDLDGVPGRSPVGSPSLPEIAEAVGCLQREDPRSGRVAELRLLAGMSMEEIAAEVGVSKPTAERDWRFARAWLGARLAADASDAAHEPDPLGDG
jgi:RNA polymerase sigma factor (TIGR02999 family)